jgi:hypothetical protein
MWCHRPSFPSTTTRFVSDHAILVLKGVSLNVPEGQTVTLVGGSAYIQLTFSMRTLARLLSIQSPRAICSARTMQVSLGGRPHRSDRSQSPQVKPDWRRLGAILLATLAKMPRMALVTRISSSSCMQESLSAGTRLH